MQLLCAFCNQKSIAICVQTNTECRAHIEDMDKETAGTRLKALREETGLSIRKMADALGMPSPSTYAHYENRYKKDYLPYDLFLKLEPIFNKHGVDSSKVRALIDNAGANEEQSMPGFSENRAPRIDVSVLLDDVEKPTNRADDPKGTIQLAIVGDTIQIAATVDSDGIDELIRRLNLARQMIE